MNDDLSKFFEKMNSSENSSRYTDPRTLNLKKIKIDSKIRKAVEKINSSSWVWTLFSCQGHKYKYNATTLPYFVFIVRNQYKAKFLELIHDTLPSNDHDRYPLTGHSVDINCGMRDEQFTVITVYWCSAFVIQSSLLQQLHKNIDMMSERMLEQNYG
jgi:tRNA(Phe) wybutosine-synthesizing methylase Tyw3